MTTHSELTALLERVKRATGPTLTPDTVLLAVAAAAAPYSGYVADTLDRHWHWGARRSLVLSRLRSLEASGLIECIGGPLGSYGYKWSITPAGRARLSQVTE